MAPTSRRWRPATATSARSGTRWPFWWNEWARWSSRRDAPHSTRDAPMEHPEGNKSAGGTPLTSGGPTRPEGGATTGRPVGERDDTDEPQLVRPYTLTAGRTDSRIDLPLEAPVETVLAPQKPPRWPGNDVRGQILTLCADSPSVAEIAAALSVPLGVARVLIGDLVTEGYLRVHTTLGDSTTDDERRVLIGRTLRGLRAL